MKNYYCVIWSILHHGQQIGAVTEVYQEEFSIMDEILKTSDAFEKANEMAEGSVVATPISICPVSEEFYTLNKQTMKEVG